MSLPTIPNITPEISLKPCDTINLLLSSIALEEIGLSNILNAEGKKLQIFLKNCPEKLEDFLKINDSVNKTLRTVVKSQILLQFKLEDVVLLHPNCTKCHDKKDKEKCHHHKDDLFNCNLNKVKFNEKNDKEV